MGRFVIFYCLTLSFPAFFPFFLTFSCLLPLSGTLFLSLSFLFLSCSVLFLCISFRGLTLSPHARLPLLLVSSPAVLLSLYLSLFYSLFIFYLYSYLLFLSCFCYLFATFLFTHTHGHAHVPCPPSLSPCNSSEPLFDAGCVLFPCALN